MFGRFGMYNNMQDGFQARQVHSSDSAARGLVSQTMPSSSELGMFLRLVSVVAVMLSAAALPMWSAG